MKIGIFGGVFNPVHLGHLRLAFLAYETVKLDQVFFVPTFRAPHKVQPEAKPEQRLAMLELAITNTSWAQIERCEINRAGKSYTLDTVKYFKNKYPKADLFLLVGEDSLNNFTHWYKYREILSYVKIVVMSRSGIKQELDTSLSQRMTANVEDFCQSPEGWIYLLSAEHLNISSSKIRQILMQNKSPKYLVPDRVLAYINEMELYESN